MEPSIWEMQQEAARRVERMQQTTRRVAAGQSPYASPTFSHRTTASLRASRPTPFVPTFENQNLPRANQNLPRAPEKSVDREQILLLLLTVFLAKNGASPQLILVLLYLAF